MTNDLGCRSYVRKWKRNNNRQTKTQEYCIFPSIFCILLVTHAKLGYFGSVYEVIYIYIGLLNAYKMTSING